MRLTPSVDFSNAIKNQHVERLAEADQLELVKDIKEYYADYQAIDSNHFSFELGRVTGEQINSWDRRQFSRCKEQLLALLLSVKKRPIIRYDRASCMATKLADEVMHAIKHESASGLFDFGGAEAGTPVLLVLDRRSDLVTPLLLQVTYQALLHDMFGIASGCVDIRHFLYADEAAPALLGPAKKAFNVVPGQDSFFAENLHTSFGAVGTNLQRIVSDLQARSAASGKTNGLESLAGIKRFLEDYPQMMKMNAVVGKHMEITEMVWQLTTKHAMLAVCEAEQAIVEGRFSLQELAELASSAEVLRPLRFKLALLYALVHSKKADFNLLRFCDVVRSAGIPDADLELIDFVIKFAHTDTQPSALPAVLGTREDSNVYTQHIPPVLSLVDQLLRAKLPAPAYPTLHTDPRDAALASQQQPIRDVIVFIIGGTTFEEACHLKRYTEKLQPTVNIVLGGTRVLNSTILVDEMRALKRHLAAR